ncbi:MAG TPA: 50S ribosomal protein L1 [Armatimonadetes bacterium]|nr:50S ribosomal protein L1 [Armatimonadota bacterium]
MAKDGSRRYEEALSKVDAEQYYGVDQAISLVKETATAGFVESMDCAIKLGVQVGKGDQNVRGTVVLPHGTGKVPRVAVFAEGEAVRAAEAAGADRVGGEDLVEAIRNGWNEFDILVAQPQMMRVVGPLGKQLGPRMPSKKAGNITDDIVGAVSALKSGRVEFKMDRGAVLHVPLGLTSFSEEQLRENFDALMAAVIAARPAAASGRFIRSITVSATMGPGVKIDPTDYATRRAA